MLVNLNKPHLWKADIAQSIDFYNRWFMRFAPKAYRETRVQTTEQVTTALKATDNLMKITPEVLRQTPMILPILRMTTAPPLARDRLKGLADVSSNLIYSMEVKHRLPPRMSDTRMKAELQKITHIFQQLVDQDICPWLKGYKTPSKIEIYRAATIIADRLCGAIADPIMRNAQEQRQLATIKTWLERAGYTFVKAGRKVKFNDLAAGPFAFRFNIPVALTKKANQVNIPVDVVIKPILSKPNEFPLLIEAKSAGDFTNTNKRRKEEAAKIAQLRNTYGDGIRFVLFLCGYFDSGYLGYEAAEGIDWVWEHRLDDLAEFGV